MNQEAKDDIAEDSMRDDALLQEPFVPDNCPCEVCAMARLCDRQRALIHELTISRDALRIDNAALREEIAAHVRGEA